MSGRIGPRVGPSDVGQRVVLRRRAAGGRFADVLGDLLAWDVEAATARVRTRAGEVAVPLADVVAGKVVPPPPPRRGAPHRVLGWAALEDVAADGWRPLETAWLGTPGRSWRLRAAEGFTGRANSVLAVGEPDDVGTPVAVAVDAVERWYGERGLPARFAVPWPLDAPRLDDGARDVAPDPELRARGYLLDTPTLFLTASLREVAAALARDVAADQLALSLSDSPDDGWLGVYRYRGQELPAVAPRVLVSAPAQAFVQLRDGGRTVAVGRAASARGWTGLSAVDVLPEYRRRGLARRVVAAAVEWGLQRGDRSGYLQVAEANAAGRALYESIGWAPHHGYHYRVRP
ncbi:MAG TPA: GNAT family N-acetyltransferase [Actinomycetales bacterium]|nr:GNAT family N-acetyltransferase [Actinomycetales bacterium]